MTQPDRTPVQGRSRALGIRHRSSGTSAVYVAMFAAFIVVLGLVPPVIIPGTLVPVTLQLMGIMLAGSVLGARLGTAAVALFVVLALIGFPLLSGGRGGIGLLFLPNGGYIVGYVAVAFVIGALSDRLNPLAVLWRAIAINLVGAVVLYCIAVPWAAVAAGIPLGASIAANAPFLPIDAVKAVVCAIVAVAVLRSGRVPTSRKR